MEILIINVHASTVIKDKLNEDAVYDKLLIMYDDAPGNIIEIIVEDFYGKIAGETILVFIHEI